MIEKQYIINMLEMIQALLKQNDIKKATEDIELYEFYIKKGMKKIDKELYNILNSQKVL